MSEPGGTDFEAAPHGMQKSPATSMTTAHPDREFLQVRLLAVGYRHVQCRHSRPQNGE